MSAAVSRDQRHLRAHPCPVCGGADQDPRGKGRRCNGFTSADGEWCRCSREDCAGALDQDEHGLYRHKMHGACNCGTQHGADVRPIRDAIEATYDYRDEDGELVFQVVRKAGKRFLQRRPDDAGGWIWKLDSTRRVLYRLPELIADDGDRPVYIVEGEKDVGTMNKSGLTATCNPGGAGKWSAVAELARKVLVGREVVVIADADDVGRKHAKEIETSLRHVAGSVEVKECTRGKDISDHFAAGGTLEELVRLREGAASEDAPPASESAPSPKPMIEFLDHAELFKPDPPADLLIPALGICSGPVTGFFGQSYVGKSICTMSLGMAVALGRDVWGQWKPRRGKWVHLDYEQGRRRCKRLIQRLAVGFDATEEELRGWVRLAVYPAVTLTTKDAVDHYARAFDGCAIATVDALKGVTAGVDENSSEMRDHMGVLRLASEKTGCVVNLNHNAGKPPVVGQRARKHEGRGSSGIFDECQTVFVATGTKGEPSLVTHEKDRELGRTVSDFKLQIVDVVVGENLGAGLRVVHLEPEQGASGNTRPRSRRAQECEAARAEAERQKAERASRARAERDATKAARRGEEDAALQAILKKHPTGIVITALRPAMAAALNGCGKDAVDTALARLGDRVKSARVKNATLYTLVTS